MMKTARSKSGVSATCTAKVLIDAVGYVCLASVKYDDCMCQTLGDQLTLSLAETLNGD